MPVITYKYKVYGKPSTFKTLDSYAWEVNRVWNYCVDAAAHAWEHHGSQPWFYADASLAAHFKGRTLPKKADAKGRIRVKYENHEPNKEFYYYNPYVATYKPNEKQTLTVRAGYLSGYDFEKLTAGLKGIFTIPSHTTSAVCQEFDKSLKTKAKMIGKGAITSANNTYFMKYRGKRSRQWIPFKGAGVKIDYQTGELQFSKRTYKVNLDRPLIGKLADGKFVKEADGWYVCLALKVEELPGSRIRESVEIGVDLGIKTLATLSNGVKYEMPEEPIVSVWGRSGTLSEMVDGLKSVRDKMRNKTGSDRSTKTKLINVNIRKLEAKLNRWRENVHYEIANKIVDQCATLAVGQLSGKFIQSAFGHKHKQVSVGLFKTRLEWIAKKNGRAIHFVDEKFTTMTCSACKQETGPSGSEGLGIREWTCSCGAIHDRDVNAAKNILGVFREENKESAAAVAV
jgi:transposase